MTQKKKSFLPDFDHPEKVEQPDEKQREKLRKKYIRKLRWQKILTVFMVSFVGPLNNPKLYLWFWSSASMSLAASMQYAMQVNF